MRTTIMVAHKVICPICCASFSHILWTNGNDVEETVHATIHDGVEAYLSFSRWHVVLWALAAKSGISNLPP